MSIKRIYTGVFLVFFGFLAACSQNTVSNFSEIAVSASLSDRDLSLLADRVSDWIEARQEEDNIPGVAVALVQGNEIILQAGFGDRDIAKQRPVTPDTLFQIGSTHKSMTALLIATLVDDGILDWDTPAIAIDSDFELDDPDSTQTVTLQHLLSMRSGIPDDAEDEFDLDNSEAEDVFEYLAEVELLGEPGDVFGYSDLAVSLAGYLAVLAVDEDEEGLYEGYARLLQERVLDPIGMKDSTILTSEAIANPNYSRSYILEDGELLEAETEDFDGDPLAPSGSLKASITDMARYISTQVNRGIAPNGDRVVSEENLLKTWQPKWGSYAMGWEIDEYQGIEVIAHEGSYDNFVSIIGIIPEYNIGFVVLTNCEDTASSLIEETPQKLIELAVDIQS
ncbi:serine hydrolase domain-containing protein [Spirulina sp. 06S082]|uniref:serine hydrolase domain-containing protein n=1 Tax=Spirulina sp. 06S082 TaxID=3110248 RepID=UPI002B1FD6AC|nr:serine hydrolase domain-containing protein [Spirulina sp. 06S082]MEA5467875.1 serine hydrolase domain-containing protein [Spirulina sp. 06S082]